MKSAAISRFVVVAAIAALVVVGGSTARMLVPRLLLTLLRISVDAKSGLPDADTAVRWRQAYLQPTGGRVSLASTRRRPQSVTLPINFRVIRLGITRVRLTSNDSATPVNRFAWFIAPRRLLAQFQPRLRSAQRVGSGPADGFAFVIQNSSATVLDLRLADGSSGGRALGYGGSGLGADMANGGEAIPNSLAVEFDTYQNTWD